jgi:hypothetical protein
MQSQNLKKELNELHRLSNELDNLKKRISSQQDLVLKLVKQGNMTKANFDYGGKNIKYKHDTGKNNITQKCIKSALKQYYPDIDANQFISYSKQFCTNKNSERMEITRRK